MIKLTKKQLTVIKSLDKALRRCEREDVYLHSHDGISLIASNGIKGLEYVNKLDLQGRQAYPISSVELVTLLSFNADMHSESTGVYAYQCRDLYKE